MRVVALFVVVCGCGVAGGSSVDATTPRGEGLRTRVVTDASAWSDLSLDDRRPDRIVVIDRAAERGDVGGVADAQQDGANADADVVGACALLGVSCVGGEACYPFPFESRAPNEVRCAFQGVGGPLVPCQSQLECDGVTMCSAPGVPDSVCLQRCSLANPRCPTGLECTTFYGFVGVGVCR
ncbi:MAG: hypothetical protein H7X95_13455 [Deltaproteobacteria bacterium]|nr:hypothetical protein [Deltaproteobacteria bacterium]